MNNYNPPNFKFQHLPIKKKCLKNRSKRTRNGYLIDTLTWNNIQEIVKIGGRVIEI